ncbi:MAG TPA: ABC transporter permease [Gemmatales bacterium]|nr:ABC transporter permease [Gemmatales bacterium]
MNRFLEPFKDLLFGIKFILVPAIYFVMTAILANAISITVRERRKEMAVLKVLGYSGRQILILILGEGLLLGVIAGTLGSWTMYYLINLVMEGINIPIGFFPLFFVPREALWWGPVSGLLVTLLGCTWPALSAHKVKVVDVFSRVA